MARVPVIAAVRDAYLFAFHHLGSVIGLIWVPMLVLTVAGFFSMQRYYNALIDVLVGGNATALGPSVLMVLGYMVAALLLYAVILVAVAQLALGQRPGGAKIHFAFGAPEWRMFRALAGLLGLALLLILTAALLGDSLMTLIGKVRLSQTQDGAVLLLLVYVLLVVLAPRFLMLLPAVSVVESEPVLRRCWTLSAGNFWRLLGVLVAIFLPVLVLFAVTQTLLSGPMPPLSENTDKMMMVSGLMHARQALPLMSGLSFLFSPFLVALFVGASITCRRALGTPEGKQDA
jgi:hypothetical protein